MRSVLNRLLWTRQWTFGFHKMRGISWLAEELSVCQEGLCCMDLVIMQYYSLSTRRTEKIFKVLQIKRYAILCFGFVLRRANSLFLLFFLSARGILGGVRVENLCRRLSNLPEMTFYWLFGEWRTDITASSETSPRVHWAARCHIAEDVDVLLSEFDDLYIPYGGLTSTACFFYISLEIYCLVVRRCWRDVHQEMQSVRSDN